MYKSPTRPLLTTTPTQLGLGVPLPHRRENIWYVSFGVWSVSLKLMPHPPQDHPFYCKQQDPIPYGKIIFYCVDEHPGLLYTRHDHFNMEYRNLFSTLM